MPLSLDKQNAYRQQYAQMRTGWKPATEVYESIIREQLEHDVCVLDIGCGRGGVLEQLGSLVEFPVGVDRDWLSLAEHRMPTLPRIVATADHIPLKNASLDIVLSSWVLEHLPEPEQTFTEIARVLKNEGVFCFITPNKNSPVAWLNRIARPFQQFLVPLLYAREEDDTFPVVYRANAYGTIKKLAKHAGLDILRFHQINDPTYLAFHPLLFRLSVVLSNLLPPNMSEHYVGVLIKRASE
jgi:SAM-dependent methyltransferase